MKRLLGAVLTVAFWIGANLSATAESPLKSVRLSRDGAGPSHIFWVKGASPPFPGKDVIGIVDPLLSAVRLYTVSRSKPESIGFDARLESIGACALPSNFRPWRILQLKNETHIESMPQPGKRGSNAKKGDFQSLIYSLRRDIVERVTPAALKTAGEAIDTTSWDPLKFVQCGSLVGSAGSVGRTAPFTATRDDAQPARTIILRNGPLALTGPQKLIVRARTGGKFQLYGVKELEPGPSGKVVQITEGVPTGDGMLRLNQRLLVFTVDSSKPTQEISFDDTHFRSKIGQRPLAVLPTGEILAMGRQLSDDKTAHFFRVQSCGFIGAARTLRNSLCGDESQSIVARYDTDTKSVQQIPPGSVGTAETQERETGNSIFSRVAKLANFRWTVDTSGLPDLCRSVAGCKVQGQDVPFVPLKGIRLTRGNYAQTGYPYAQTESSVDFDRFAKAYENREFENALKNVKTEQRSLPGNLADGFTGDLGIDCSGLLQVAWAGRASDPSKRLSTSALQNGSDISYRCANRLPDISYLRSGDAIGIHVDPGADHVVLYGANLPFDGASSSWLVLESTSSCDGVCWSVYEPSFFNGWGLYRASNRKDKACPPSSFETSIKNAPFPSKFMDWRNKVVDRLPLHGE